MMQIYHNSRCGKSRKAIQYFADRHFVVEVIEYLKNPTSRETLTDIIIKPGLKVKDFIRTKESLYQERFADQTHNDSEWIEIIVDNPILLERPIIVTDKKAWIARSDEMLEQISLMLKKS